MTTSAVDLSGLATRNAGVVVRPRRMNQLDAWRGLAILAVMLQHYYPDLIRFLPVGHIGVQLFFVLSGFLITGILMRCRRAVDGGQGVMFTMRQFVIRRALRIFPVYYLCLGLALLATWAGMEVQGLREGFWWLATYMSNFYFAWTQQWGGIFFPLWSMSVTEQFYLVWPFIILLLPRQRIVPAVMITVAIGLGWKVIASLMQVNFFIGHCLPFGSWDALGLGALMAIAADGQQYYTPSNERFWRLLPITALLLIAISVILRRWENLQLQDARLLHIDLPLDVGSTLLGIWAIRGSATGFGGIGAVILSLRPLTYLGTISYGLYIFHPFLIRLADKITKHLGGVWMNPVLSLALFMAISVACCAVCWHVFEAPINNFKRFFPYKKAAAPAR